MVITDVWTSMGQEEERQSPGGGLCRGYCVNEQLMASAKPDAMVQHCLPAHRGEEITEEVFEANAAVHLRGGGEPPPRPEGRAGENHGRRKPGRVKRERLSGQRKAACRLIKSRCAAFCFVRRRSPFHSQEKGM